MAGSTPIYGFPYPEPSDLVANYPALGQDLAEDIEAVLPTIGGTAIVAPTSIANSGGTATASGGEISFSGVTSISLNGVFTSAYQNYVAVIRYAQSATGVHLRGRMRLAGTDATADYYGAGTGRTSLGGTANISDNNANSFLFINLDSNDGTQKNYARLDISDPNITSYSVFVGQASTMGSSGEYYQMAYGGMHKAATAYDGVTFYVASGNITGKLRIYGLKNS